MRISDWSSDVCSSDLCPDTPAHWRDPWPFSCRRNSSCCPERRAQDWPDTCPAARMSTAPVAPPMRSNTGIPHERSEERRVGQECVRTCRSRLSQYTSKKQTIILYQSEKQITTQ